MPRAVFRDGSRGLTFFVAIFGTRIRLSILRTEGGRVLSKFLLAGIIAVAGMSQAMAWNGSSDYSTETQIAQSVLPGAGLCRAARPKPQLTPEQRAQKQGTIRSTYHDPKYVGSAQQ